VTDETSAAAAAAFDLPRAAAVIELAKHMPLEGGR